MGNAILLLLHIKQRSWSFITLKLSGMGEVNFYQKLFFHIIQCSQWYISFDVFFHLNTLWSKFTVRLTLEGRILVKEIIASAVLPIINWMKVQKHTDLLDYAFIFLFQMLFHMQCFVLFFCTKYSTQDVWFLKFPYLKTLFRRKVALLRRCHSAFSTGLFWLPVRKISDISST